MEIIIWGIVLWVGWRFAKRMFSRPLATANLSLEQCSEIIRLSLLRTAQAIGDMGKDFMPFSYDIIKCASAIRIRPDHIPTICMCLVWSCQTIEEHIVHNPTLYSEDERKKAHAFLLLLASGTNAAIDQLVKLQGRRATDEEKEEVARFLDEIRWDNETKQFMHRKSDEGLGQATAQIAH